MSVTNGQLANQTTFNDAFVSRTAAQDVAGGKQFSNYVAFTRANVATAATIAAMASTTSFVKLTGSTTTEVQGITAGINGQLLTIYNGSTATITFTHESGSATAANRIDLPENRPIYLYADCSIQFVYDTVLSRWVLSSSAPVFSDSTFKRKFKYTSASDNTSGTAVTLAAATTPVVSLTHASLVSVGGLPAGEAGQLVYVVNNTGVSINILDEDTGTTAANRIRTGTAISSTVQNHGTIILFYDSVESRWNIIGGSGNVLGPSSSTNNAIARFNGATGAILKDSPETTVSDAGTITTGDGGAPSYTPTGASLVISSTDDDNGVILRSEGSAATVESFISNWAGAGVAGGFAGTLSAHPYFFGTGGINRFSIDANGETIFATSATPGGSPYTPFGSVLTAVVEAVAALDAFAVYDDIGTLKAKIDKDGKFFGPSGDDLQTQIDAISAGGRSVTEAFTGTSITPGSDSDKTWIYTGGSVQTFTGFGTISGLVDGTIVRIMGSSDTNYLELSESDASDGWLMNGPATLTRGSSVTFEYSDTIGRMVEICRN